MPPTIESPLLRSAATTHEQAIEDLSRITDGLTDTQANWKPTPEAWSVAQCIDHLDRSLGTYLDRMAPAIERARREGKTGREPYGRGTLAGRMLIGFLSKPSKKAPAPRVFQPGASQLEISEVAGAFREKATELVDLAAQADGLPLGRIRIATPISRLVRLSLAQAFEVHILHTPRHLAQAQRVMEHESFPV